MSKTMRKKGISVRDKMDTFNLSFDLKEFLESISNNLINNPESSVYSNGKRAWFGDTKPEIISQIDRQLRKRYSINDNKMVACVHYPPEKDDNGRIIDRKLTIKENKENVLYRFIISTIHEVCDITFNGSEPETFDMKSWVAYKVPEMIGGMLAYDFKNDKNLIIPAKKGFRQVRKIKALDNRHIIVLDYLVSKREFEELSELLKNKKTGRNEKDDNIDEAINSLKL